MIRQLILLISVVLMVSGCRSNQPQPTLFGNANGYNAGYAASGPAFTPDNTAAQQAALQASQAAQANPLNSQLVQFDSDNQNLYAQVAALQQRLQNANSYNDQLKQQLADQMAQLQHARTQAQQAAIAQTAQAANAGSGFQNAGYQSGTPGNPAGFNGATIRANNGLMQNIQAVQLPGFKAWMDGDVIRIEGPTDRLFVSGTYQINQNDTQTLTNLASIIRQNFPRQLIGVEAHWDGTPIQPATTSHHQLTATQALSVFDVLIRSGLPEKQVFTLAMGSNRLRYPVGNPANRRIEIVIYPETFQTP